MGSDAIIVRKRSQTAVLHRMEETQTAGAVQQTLLTVCASALGIHESSRYNGRQGARGAGGVRQPGIA
jgi:hypothetical protein